MLTPCVLADVWAHQARLRHAYPRLQQFPGFPVGCAGPFPIRYRRELAGDHAGLCGQTGSGV